MSRYVPWTVAGLLSTLVLLGSAALAQWEPQEREPVKWFTPPPVFEDVLDPDLSDQELCYLVIRVGGRPVPFQYTVRPHYPRNGERWYLPPIVIREEQKSVWRTMMELFNEPRNLRR